MLNTCKSQITPTGSLNIVDIDNIPMEILQKRTKCEIFARIVGYLRPTSLWNKGKAEEFKDRLNFNLKKAI